MALRLPSNVKPFVDHFSQDPAFEQAPTPPGSDADDETVKAYKKALEEYQLKLNNATDTGDWSPLRVQGSAEPTRFTMKLIAPDALGKLDDMRSAGTGLNELAVTAFRLGLQDVNIEGVKVGRVRDDKFGTLASIDWLADAGGTGVALMVELGLRVFMKSSAVRPF